MLLQQPLDRCVQPGEIILELCGTCEQGPHDIDGQTSHAEGFGQGILDTQVGQQLDGKDLPKREKQSSYKMFYSFYPKLFTKLKSE